MEGVTYFLARNVQKDFFIKNQEYLKLKDLDKYLLGNYTKKSGYEFSEFTNDRLRPVAGASYKKRGVLLFGCSHIYGMDLSIRETISGQLAEYTKRPVYNKAFLGWSPAHMLYFLQHKDECLGDVSDPEYVICLYHPGYILRLIFFQGWPHDSGKYLRYELDKDNNLKIVDPKEYNIFWRLYFVKYVQYYIEHIKMLHKEKIEYLYLRIMEENMKLLNKYYPNSQKIILFYQGGEACKVGTQIVPTKFYFDDQQIPQKLEKMGYKIENLEALNGHNLCEQKYVSAVTHPSPLMWKETIPLLAKKYNM